ncbi:Ger(x)C family spore germination protein [Paenibacillus sp. SYP-B3998]|uniref:Ger(X)C family spore germination protein n=2 Tax=Paenibacillus sp. SYP-B3998 TaxID=2678564 RepID=A0A6G3ZT27_9BACL|nr:Ger(x)C family spore germination protein [Paenibacillus sp. SYP-B3998]
MYDDMLVDHKVLNHLKNQIEELDFGHAKMVLIGENIIEENLRESLDWFNRRRGIQMVAWIAIGKPSAEAVLATQTSQERLPGISLLLSFGKTGVESGFIVSEYMFDFFRKQTEWGLDPILPVVEASGNHYTINTSIVFDKIRARLTLNSDETRLFNVIKATVNKVEFEAPIDDSKIFISVDSIKSKYRVYTPRGTPPHVDLRINMSGVIEEAYLKVSSDKLASYQESTEKTGRERIKKLLRRLQKENLDPFGFGLNYRARHFGNVEEEWKAWQSLYPELDFRVQIHLKLEGTGTIK